MTITFMIVVVMMVVVMVVDAEGSDDNKGKYDFSTLGYKKTVLGKLFQPLDLPMIL